MHFFKNSFDFCSNEKYFDIADDFVKYLIKYCLKEKCVNL